MPAFTERRAGSVAVLTWDRQEARNALDPTTLLALSAAIEAASDDPDVRACVLTGAGTVAFSAGMDLKALAAGGHSVGAAVAAWEAAVGSPDRVPLVAAVNGMAMGGGFEIVLRCDLVVAGDAVVFGLPEVKRKLVPGGGGLLLPRRIPLALALELGLTGASVSAARLHELGLVNRLVPSDHVVDEAVALAAGIAQHAPETVAAIRRGMWASVADTGPR
jgi:enoyl-CoA hydratase